MRTQRRWIVSPSVAIIIAAGRSKLYREVEAVDLLYLPMRVCIREAGDKDRQAVLSVEHAAFEASGEAEEGVQLGRDALDDPTASELGSLMAFEDNTPVGHILLTKAHLNTHPNRRVALLAPLAVLPAFQKQGIGGQLIEEGMKQLEQQGVELVFVTGHPSYYPRHGFRCAFDFGFDPPYPEEKYPDSWMVRELCPGAIDKLAPGKLVCAKSIDRPEYWQAPPQVIQQLDSSREG